MNPLQAVRALGPIDARSIWRDSLLRWLFGMALAFGIALRYGVPPLSHYLLGRYGFDLVPYYPLIMSLMLMVAPIIVGTIIGFLLLDERDDRTLTALQVTPLTLRGYLVYRLTLPVIASVILSVVVFLIADLVRLGALELITVAVVGGLLAPLFALFLAGFAANKVQGFGLMKANGFITAPPLVAWFVHEPWQWAFGLAPTYWPVKAFWQMYAHADYGLYLGLGVAFQLGILWLLVKRFDAVMRR
ncbi:MAG: hypothetical protein P8Y95_10025 [Gammaproteobacteria bacterium]|jgi:fluoroquinolone transport system permease protein